MMTLQNTTIAKLNRNEISELGLYSEGVMTYRGELKSRVNGYKKQVQDETTSFIGEHIAFEFIRIPSLNEMPEYAMRIKDMETGNYEPIVYLGIGCKFLR